MPEHEPAEPAGPPEPTRVYVGGVRIDLHDHDGIVAIVEERLGTRPAVRPAPRSAGRLRAPLAIASVNLDHVYHFGIRARSWRERSPGLEWLMLLDGSPVARRTRGIGGVRWPRLPGADLLPDLLAAAEQSGARVGFLGGPGDADGALARVLHERWPGLALAGAWAPDRAVIDDMALSHGLACTIAAADVDLLIVGLGKPRQEWWIHRHGAQTGARVIAGFGAAADFLAGRSRRAPEWMRRAGVEWAYRLAHEPRRLSRRYLVQGPLALGALWVSRPYVTVLPTIEADVVPEARPAASSGP